MIEKITANNKNKHKGSEQDMTQTYQIHSLADYFSVIENLQLKDYISRGEADQYPEILSSAFRPYQTTGKYYGQAHLQEFYNCIGNRLTPLQQKHFLAYAQHSGLPTNLIDFSTSPQVSLFFSTYDADISTSSKGYVHFIRKNRLFPVDSYVANGYSGSLRKKLDQKTESILEVWLNQYDYEKAHRVFDYDDPEFKTGYVWMLISFIRLIKNQLPSYTSTPMAHMLKMTCANMEEQLFTLAKQPNGFSLIHDFLYESLIKLLEIFEEGDIAEDTMRTENAREYLYQQGLSDRIYNSFSYFDDLAPHGFTDLTISELLGHLAYVAMELAMYSTEHNYYLPFYATYSPPNISGRVSMQNSIFIVQTFYAGKRYRNEPKPLDLLISQKILPDITLEISDKKKIQTELDMVGINLKTIYGDDDNIAKYIKNKL